MGLFDLFKKKARPASSTTEAPPDDAPPALGWDALTRALETVYSGQTNPVHRAPLVHRRFDLSESAAAFDGISAYDAGDHWHFVTFGLTELYVKEAPDLAVSGFGCELTFKLPKLSEAPPPWAFDFLEAIGKSVRNGAILGPGHTIKTGPLDGRASTRETSVLVVRDPSFPEPLDTPNGRVELLLLLGVEDHCRQRVLAAHQAHGAENGWEVATVTEIRARNPELVTPIETQGEWGAT
jgi:hypothetical protein